jgi:hypothetical protein
VRTTSKSAPRQRLKVYNYCEKKTLTKVPCMKQISQCQVRFRSNISIIIINDRINILGSGLKAAEDYGLSRLHLIHQPIQLIDLIPFLFGITNG